MQGKRMYKIAVITATRAEYGLLSPFIKRVMRDDLLELDLIVTGGHLSETQGMTVGEIVGDKIPVMHRISILEDGDTPYDISVTMANATKGFAQCFRDDRPDMVVLLGDRTELLGIAAAAMNELIPIAHIHGGETTEGAVDESIRHAITKMSHLHFTSCEEYRKRVIQLGESPDRVFNVGALGIENIKSIKTKSVDELSADIGFDMSGDYALFTYHPVTMENETEGRDIRGILAALDAFSDLKVLFTKANADRGGIRINRMIDEYVAAHRDRCVAVFSLGMERYLSAVSHAAVIIGNSSSGIIESPSFGVPAVNIGDRQKGRIRAGNILDCTAGEEAVTNAIGKALSDEFTAFAKMAVNPYGDGHTSEKIVFQIKEYFTRQPGNLKKKFYDIPFDIK